MLRTLAVIAVLIVLVGTAGWYGYRWWTTVPPTQANLAYGSASDRQVLDLYLPEAASGPVPVVVWVHGGAFMMGDKSDPQSLAALRAAGFAVAAINYRLSGTDQWPAQRDDVMAAVAYLRANATDLGIDPARIALFGASAGGHLVSTAGLTLAADPGTAVRAVVDWYGPVDFTTMDADMEATRITRATGRNDAADSPESALIGATVADNPELARAASPLQALADLPEGAQLPPFLIMHGDADDFVAPAQSERLRDALLAHPGQSGVTFEIVPGAGHGSGAFQEAQASQTVVDFLSATFAQP
jgi:acetyl esterase/lipase